MKVRKFLSSLLSVAMLSTFIGAFTVAQAASTPTMTATATYDEEYKMIAVTVSYSGMDDLAPNSGNALKPTITGISQMSFVVTCDNPALTYYAGVEAISAVTVSSTTSSAAISLSKASELVTANSSDLATFYFEGSKDAVAKFEVTEPKIRVKAYTTGKLQSTTDYQGEQITCVGATYGSSAPVLADFTALNAAIAAYEAKTEADYTAESWATAKAAYDTAKAIDQTAETDQTVVDAATTALNAAIAALELKPVDKVEVKPDTTVVKKDNPSGLWTFGFGGTVEITGSKTFSKLIFTLEDTVNGKTGSYTWDFETPINANVTYGLNIMGCPVDSNVTATVKAQ